MIILHLFLVLDRLNKAGPEGARLARHLSETFVTDIDDCLREMGVGDLSVPRKVKRAAQAYGERCMAYLAALEPAAAPSAIEDALQGTIPGIAGKAASAARLARYVKAAREHLASLPDAEVLAGKVTYPHAP